MRAYCLIMIIPTSPFKGHLQIKPKLSTFFSHNNKHEMKFIDALHIILS